MGKMNVINLNGEKVKDINLNKNVFDCEANEIVLKKAIDLQLASLRQGTQKTKSRAEVSGGGRKPYKQKGTGNARQGSTKAPHQIGGGVAFAPKPRDFSKKINKQAKRLAFLSALSTKLAQNEITVVDEFKLNEVKTKEIQNFLNAFKFDKSVVLVTEDKNADVLRAGANIPTVSVTTADLLNTYEVVANKNVVLTKAAIKSIEEAYAE